ncbi:MAG: hypothetical protein SNJ52_00400 [Verrucomicrobiia bacterium]
MRTLDATQRFGYCEKPEVLVGRIGASPGGLGRCWVSEKRRGGSLWIPYIFPSHVEAFVVVIAVEL